MVILKKKTRVYTSLVEYFYARNMLDLHVLLPSFCSTFHVESFPTNPYSFIWISYEEISAVCFNRVGFRVVWTGKRSFFTVLTVVMVFAANHWKSKLFVQFCNENNKPTHTFEIWYFLFCLLGRFKSKGDGGTQKQ